MIAGDSSQLSSCTYEEIYLVSLQGLSRATDISSSDAEVRKNGIKLLSSAIKVIFSFAILPPLQRHFSPTRNAHIPDGG